MTPDPVEKCLILWNLINLQVSTVEMMQNMVDDIHKVCTYCC